MRLEIVAPEEFGERCCDAFLSAVADVGPRIGLPTGRSPLPLYQVLRERVAAGLVKGSRVRRLLPYAIDEYVSERPGPCSNVSYFREHWESIPGAEPVRCFDGSAADLIAEARRFGRALVEAGGLDVAVLGIGMNGHLAFNEPGCDPFGSASLVGLSEASRREAMDCWGARAPTQGLTLGLSELLAARRLLLLASGPHKAGIVARALAGPITSACPASLLQEHQDIVVVLDEPAASALPRSQT